MQSIDSLKGFLLVAMPNLDDPNFTHSVIYLCEHNEHGAMGIIINHPLSVSLSELLVSMDLTPYPGQESVPVFFGGPLQQDRGFVLHRPTKQSWQSSLDLDTFISLTTSKDVLQAIASNQGPKDPLIALGYAAWENGNLEKELAQNVWLSVPASEDILFEVPAELRWQAAALQLGVDIRQISGDIGHA